MLRLRMLETFQPLRAGRDKAYIKVFTDDHSIPPARNILCYADILFNEESGLILIREHDTGIVHFISANNVLNANPHPTEYEAVWKQYEKKLEDHKQPQGWMPESVDIKRRGRPPKVQDAKANNVI